MAEDEDRMATAIGVVPACFVIVVVVVVVVAVVVTFMSACFDIELWESMTYIVSIF